MFIKDETLRPFERKLWLSSPTMHGPELEYMKEAFENWMSTFGENLNEVERLAAKMLVENMQLRFPLALPFFIWQ